MDEVSSHVRLDLPSGKVAPKTVPPRPRKRVLASDLDTVMVDSLKALDLIRPIREADITVRRPGHFLSAGLTRYDASSEVGADR